MTEATNVIDAKASAEQLGELMSEMTDFRKIVSAHKGQKIAVLCARYQYRGVVAHIAEDCVVLANARSVEISGPSAAQEPEREDDIGGFVAIKFDAIEIAYQPTWSQFQLSNEDAEAVKE